METSSGAWSPSDASSQKNSRQEWEDEDGDEHEKESGADSDRAGTDLRWRRGTRTGNAKAAKQPDTDVSRDGAAIPVDWSRKGPGAGCARRPDKRCESPRGTPSARERGSGR